LIVPGEQVVVGATVSQPLFRRPLFPSRTAGRLGVESNQATLARTHEQLMMDVTSSFIGVLRSRQQIRLAESSVKRAEALLQNISARVKVGAGLKAAELLASIDVSRARVQLASAVGEEHNQEATFERLMGISPPEKLVLPTTPAPAPSTTAVRSDLRALHFSGLQSLATEDVLRGRLFWPTLDAQGAVSYTAPVGVLTDPLVWTATANLTVPLFQGGDEWVQLRLQKYRTETTVLQEKALRTQITEEIRRAEIHIDTVAQTLKLAEEQVQVAQQNYNLVVTQFRLSAISFLEVANAQSALTEAENLLLVTGYERELAAYQLLFAAGQLALGR
jgi:outer membrane protein TolC